MILKQSRYKDDMIKSCQFINCSVTSFVVEAQHHMKLNTKQSQLSLQCYQVTCVELLNSESRGGLRSIY